MAHAEYKIDLVASQEDAQKAYGIWAPEHVDGDFITYRAFDQSDPYQNFDNVRIPPSPDIELAIMLGRQGIGSEVYETLTNTFDELGVVSKAMSRAKKQRSSLVATLHVRNVFDTPSTHNVLFAASGGDHDVAEVNDVIANPMMCRLNMGPLAVYKVLSTSGSIDLLLPYRAARRHGMSPETGRYLDSRMKASLNQRLDSGVIVHWALSGTRSKRVLFEEGHEGRVVTHVDEGIAALVVEKTAFVTPVPIVMEAGQTMAEVLEPRIVKKTDDVHELMEEMTRAASSLSGEDIRYGLPKGAKIIEQVEVNS